MNAAQLQARIRVLEQRVQHSAKLDEELVEHARYLSP